MPSRVGICARIVGPSRKIFNLPQIGNVAEPFITPILGICEQLIYLRCRRGVEILRGDVRYNLMSYTPPSVHSQRGGNGEAKKNSKNAMTHS